MGAALMTSITQTYMPVPREAAGFIIGGGGDNIKRIKSRTHCDVHVITDDDEDKFWASVRIQGTTVGNVEHAKRLVVSSVWYHGINKGWKDCEDDYNDEEVADTVSAEENAGSD
jgi:hypothetical protein